MLVWRLSVETQGFLFLLKSWTDLWHYYWTLYPGRQCCTLVGTWDLSEFWGRRPAHLCGLRQDPISLCLSFLSYKMKGLVCVLSDGSPDFVDFCRRMFLFLFPCYFYLVLWWICIIFPIGVLSPLRAGTLIQVHRNPVSCDYNYLPTWWKSLVHISTCLRVWASSPAPPTAPQNTFNL